MNATALPPFDPAQSLARAREVLRIEADAIAEIEANLDDQFSAAVQCILACTGRVVVSGIGKSGHVGRKIAATLASTGSPAFFVHPAEASHGDLGMITHDDVCLALSYSGETQELLTIVPLIKRMGAKLIAITGQPNSGLAQLADIHLNARVSKEACPLNLAPTASTTAALALGDALAVALLEARGFGKEDFARSHPGGTLGRRLLTHVSDVMRAGDAVPKIHHQALLPQALLEITAKRLGMTAVLDDAGTLIGIFTDGDLRRAIEQGHDIRHIKVCDVMTPNPRTIAPWQLADEAVAMMEQYKVNQVLVLEDGVLVGALNMHDLFAAKVL
ncbi:MAG: KpsF/GutQ family sugar-phosphate isomerase [Burkholderiaceae bacterium]|nr:MAG: KpsF/GutQ family sugar-phosphate isomerase [Burkholderiaceae bacterium]